MYECVYLCLRCLGDFAGRRSRRRLVAAARVGVVGGLHLDISSSSALVIVHGLATAGIVAGIVGTSAVIAAVALGLVVGGRVLVGLLRLLGLVVGVILGLAVAKRRPACPARPVERRSTVLASATRAEASERERKTGNVSDYVVCGGLVERKPARKEKRPRQEGD